MEEDDEALDAHPFTSQGIPVITTDASRQEAAPSLSNIGWPSRQSTRPGKCTLTARAGDGAARAGGMGARVGCQWVLLRSDNSVVRGILSKETSPSEQLRAVYLRILQLLRRHSIDMRARHIPGRANGLADCLSPWRPQRNSKDWRLTPSCSPSWTASWGSTPWTPLLTQWGPTRSCPISDRPLTTRWARTGRASRSGPTRRLQAAQGAAPLKTAYSAMPASTAATFVIPLWGKLTRCWPMLRGARVLGWFPQGSTVFDRPDTDGLDSAVPGSALIHRLNCSITPWYVAVVHSSFPPARFRSAGELQGPGAPLGSHRPTAQAMASLPRLSVAVRLRRRRLLRSACAAARPLAGGVSQ